VTPLVSLVVMPAGVLALMLMPFGLEAVPLAVMEWGISWMLATAHWVASWPGAVQAVGSIPPAALMFQTAGGLWIALWQAGWRWLGIMPILAGCCLAFSGTAPELLIAGDGANIAVRGQDGQLHFLSPRRGRFDAEIWLRTDGDPRDVSEALKPRPGGFRCDEAGCLVQINGRADAILSAAASVEAVVEDCNRMLVLVDLARGAKPYCREPQLVVTRDTLLREGAISAWLEPSPSGGVNVRWTSVARERGNRLWTPKRNDQ
jgi:competence protein ComEC